MKLREVHAYLRLLQPPEFVAASQLSKKVKEECLSFPEHLKTLKTVENSQRYSNPRILTFLYNIDVRLSSWGD